MDTRIALAGSFVAGLALAGQSQATYNYPPPPPPPTTGCHVTADADDHYGNSYGNDRFWGIDFTSGNSSAFIQSVEIDLQAGSDGNAIFDLSGGDFGTSSSGGSAWGPAIGELDGLSASDITFAPETGQSPTLTISFAAGTFGAGDSFRFGADTDHLGQNNDGADPGRKAVGFTVTFEDGSSFTTRYFKTSGWTSEANVWHDGCDPGTGIPTPGAAAMGLVLLGGLATRRRRKSD